MISLGLSDYFDHFVATLDDANVDELMQFFPKSGPCFMPPNHEPWLDGVLKVCLHVEVTSGLFLQKSGYFYIFMNFPVKFINYYLLIIICV